MIKINGQYKRNLQEQVLKNKEDIEDLKSGRTNPSFSDITGEPSDNSNLNNALNSKVDKITGKGLSTNDFSNADKSKLDGINMSQKQDLLTAEQMAAVDSGMTAADVTAIGALITQMLTKSPLLEAGTNITLTTLGSGKIRIDATGGGGGGTWGSITGSLSNQIDLFNALNEKLGVNALTPYRTAANQDTIDTSIRDLATSETNRAIAKENELATAISGCLTSAKLVEGQSIDITVNPDGTVVISCSIEAMELKGSVNTFADLPTTARNGDTYIVRSNFKVYTYTSSGWVQSGAAFDITLFYTKTECDERFALATALAIEIGNREVADTSLGQRITNIELGYIKEVSISGNAITFTKQNDATVIYTPDLSAYRTSADQDTIDTALQTAINGKSTVTGTYNTDNNWTSLSVDGDSHFIVSAYSKTEVDNLLKGLKQTIYDGIYPVNSTQIGFQAPSVPSDVTATWTDVSASYNGRYFKVSSTDAAGTAKEEGITINNTTLTIDQIPSHNHSATTDWKGGHTHSHQGGVNVYENQSGYGTIYTLATVSDYSGGSNFYMGEGGGHNHVFNTDNKGGGGGHNHSASGINPVATTIKVWKRTA